MNPEVPAFMAPDIPPEPPELNPSKITVGSTIILVHPSYRYQGSTSNTPLQVKVTSKARVWIEACELGSSTIYRLRLDTQTDGSDSYYSYRFRTLEQHRYFEAHSTASSYLWSQGIRFETSSKWDSEKGRIELARMIWSAQNTPEEPAVPFTVHHLDGSSTTYRS